MNSLSEARTRPAVEPDMSTAREIRHSLNGLGSDVDSASAVGISGLTGSFCGDCWKIPGFGG